MDKLRYILLIVGISVGLILSYTAQSQGAFWDSAPVPLGLIGYGVGALFGPSKESH